MRPGPAASPWVCQICGGEANEGTLPLCIDCTRVVDFGLPHGSVVSMGTAEQCQEREV